MPPICLFNRNTYIFPYKSDLGLTTPPICLFSTACSVPSGQWRLRRRLLGSTYKYNFVYVNLRQTILLGIALFGSPCALLLLVAGALVDGDTFNLEGKRRLVQDGDLLYVVDTGLGVLPAALHVLYQSLTSDDGQR